MNAQDPCVKELEEYQEAMKECEIAKAKADEFKAIEPLTQGGETPPKSDLSAIKTAFDLLKEAEIKEEEKRKSWQDCKKRHRVTE